MSSKVTKDTLYECVNGMLETTKGDNDGKKRKFLETVE
ncbi:unnamed protein product, partial [Medioppia subpectinata]